MFGEDYVRKVISRSEKKITSRLTHKASGDQFYEGKSKHDKEALAALRLMAAESQHPYIVEYTHYERKGDYWIVVSRSAGDIDLMDWQIAQKGGRFSLGESLDLFGQMCSAAEFIHSIGVCHGDISQENFVVSPGGQLKMIDFDLALTAPKDKHTGLYDFTRTGIRGKFPLLAPDVFPDGSYYKSDRVDVWALGCVLLCLVSGSYLYQKPDKDDLGFQSLFAGSVSQLRHHDRTNFEFPLELESLIHLLFFERKLANCIKEVENIVLLRGLQIRL